MCPILTSPIDPLISNFSIGEQTSKTRSALLQYCSPHIKEFQNRSDLGACLDLVVSQQLIHARLLKSNAKIATEEGDDYQNYEADCWQHLRNVWFGWFFGDDKVE
jgi:hypothetical protein